MSSGVPNRLAGMRFFRLGNDSPGPALGHVALNEAGGHRVDRDLPAGQFAAQAASQADQPGLRGRIVGLAWVADESRDAGHVDDPAVASPHHVPGSRPREQERPAQVRVEHAVPLVVASFAASSVSRVMPALLTRMSKRSHFSTTASTTWFTAMARSFTSQANGSAVPPAVRMVVHASRRGLFAHVGARDLGAAKPQFQGDRLAQASRGAGDQGDLAGQIDGERGEWIGCGHNGLRTSFKPDTLRLAGRPFGRSAGAGPAAPVPGPTS